MIRNSRASRNCRKSLRDDIGTPLVTDLKARQSLKIQEIGQALMAAGFSAADHRCQRCTEVITSTHVCWACGRIVTCGYPSQCRACIFLSSPPPAHRVQTVVRQLHSAAISRRRFGALVAIRHRIECRGVRNQIRTKALLAIRREEKHHD